MSEEQSPAPSVIVPLNVQLLEPMSCVPYNSTVIKDDKTAVYNNLNSRYAKVSVCVCMHVCNNIRCNDMSDLNM